MVAADGRAGLNDHRQPENEVSQRCYQCFRPLSLCFCEAIPTIDNRTDVLILQHTAERAHPFNTARIVRRALRRCRLMVETNRRLASHWLPLSPNAGLLFPRANARRLAELPAAERPSQLVIIDGTWQQAKSIVRDVPRLRELPCYRLEPPVAGRYRIRLEPNAESLSTLEATVAALRVLERETAGLDQLLFAFDKMVDDQLSHPTFAAYRRSLWQADAKSRHESQLPPSPGRRTL